MTERVAMVTGGARGIGREICLALARDGRRVAVADLRAEAAEETAALILHQQNDDEQQDDGPLRSLLGNIDCQSIIKDVGLNEVQNDEYGVGQQRKDIELAQRCAVSAALRLGTPDQPPDCQLVGGVQPPD